jgi:hypothetical protein
MKQISTISILSILIFSACNTSNDNADTNQTQTIINDTMTYPAKHISVSINRPAAEVYQFTSNPENFPKWVAFVKSITNQTNQSNQANQGPVWIGKTDLGEIKFRFSPQNNFGILDHEVTLPDGEKVSNPMRVVANNKGCEFIFTLFRLPNRTEEEFSQDAKAVTDDLQKLKEIMENK